MIDLNQSGAIGLHLQNRDFCVMQIELADIEPAIRRTVLLPKSANLGWVHAVIQVTMGWNNSHLHQFRSGETVISDPKFGMDEFEDDPPVTDERTVTVEQILQTKIPILTYEYDFGDSWNHLLTFKQLSKGQHAAVERAVCIDGQRASPPEDCGGVGGYEELLTALADKRHPEHAATKRWIGRRFDPEAFSIDKANRFLAKLPWPVVSIPALGKVLAALHRQKA